MAEGVEGTRESWKPGTKKMGKQFAKGKKIQKRLEEV